jgi:hypothetical protein
VVTVLAILSLAAGLLISYPSKVTQVATDQIMMWWPK